MLPLLRAYHDETGILQYKDVVNGDAEQHRQPHEIIYRRHRRPVLPLLDCLRRCESEVILHVLYGQTR